jgi:hypothetical protein
MVESSGPARQGARLESWKIPNETAIAAIARMRNMNFTRTGVALIERSGPQAADGLGNDDPCGGGGHEDFKCFDHCPVLKPVKTNLSRLSGGMMSRV